MSHLSQYLGHVGHTWISDDFWVLEYLGIVSETFLTLHILTALPLPLLNGSREHILALFYFELSAHHLTLCNHWHVSNYNLCIGVLIVYLEH